MSADETLFTVQKGRPSLVMEGEFNWIVFAKVPWGVTLMLHTEGEAKAVAKTLTRYWTCRAPDGKAPCPYAGFCKNTRMRLQILARKRGVECEFYRGFEKPVGAQSGEAAP